MPLLKQAGFFVSGFAAAILPFALYLAAKGALYEAARGTFIVPFLYGTGGGGFNSASEIVTALLLLTPALAGLFSGFVLIQFRMS